jgi:hypothetical protein
MYIEDEQTTQLSNYILSIFQQEMEVKLTIYYLLALDYFEAIINIHKEHFRDTFILLLTNY